MALATEFLGFVVKSVPFDVGIQNSIHWLSFRIACAFWALEFVVLSPISVPLEELQGTAKEVKCAHALEVANFKNCFASRRP